MTINPADQDRTEELLRDYTIRRLLLGRVTDLALSSDQKLYYSGSEGYVLRKSHGYADNPFVEFRVRAGIGNTPADWVPAKFEKAFSCCHATHRLVPQDNAIPFPFDRSQLQHPSYEQLEATVSKAAVSD